MTHLECFHYLLQVMRCSPVLMVGYVMKPSREEDFAKASLVLELDAGIILNTAVATSLE